MSEYRKEEGKDVAGAIDKCSEITQVYYGVHKAKLIIRSEFGEQVHVESGKASLGGAEVDTVVFQRYNIPCVIILEGKEEAKRAERICRFRLQRGLRSS